MKKFSKFCLTAASLAALAGGVLYYFNNSKKDEDAIDDLDDEFDDFDDGYDDIFDNLPVDKREYVSLTYPKKADAEAETNRKEEKLEVDKD